MHKWVRELFNDAIVEKKPYLSYRCAYYDALELMQYYPELPLVVVPCKVDDFKYPIQYKVEVGTHEQQTIL